MRDTFVLRALKSFASRVALSLMLTLVAMQATAQTVPAFVQGNQSVPKASESIVAVPFAALQSAGDLNVVVVGWRNTSVDVQSVVDTNGNTYVLAAGPTLEPEAGAQSVYYAANIVASTPNTVTITFTGPAAWADVRMAEYSGVDPVAPVEAAAAAQGWDEVSDSGSLITSSAHALLVAANFVQSVVTQAGPGFTPRGITTPSTNVLEDRVVTPGTYNATASVAPGVPWIMQLVAFRAAPTVDGEAPTAPVGLTATSASSDQIDLSWMPSTDNSGVTSYLIERCQDPGCISFILMTTNGTSYSDSGLAPSTTYSYRVRATDAANNLSAYSNIATTTTDARPDTEAPTTPGGLTATAVSSTEITLAWTDSTDDVGVVNYLIERCQGAGCSAFAQIAVSGSGYTDSGLVPSTSYTYRVRASDAAGNVSGYSNLATATPPMPPDTESPSEPGALTATAASGTAITLAWTGSTDNVGVTDYLIERCQGGGCTAFAQIATATTAGFSDAGLTDATTYRYRVRATDDAGNLSGYSNIATATTADTQAPSAAGSFTGTASSSNQVSLTWTAAIDNVGIAGYRVSRDGNLIATVTALSYVDSGLAASTAYLYAVVAVDGAGNTSAAASTSVTTPAESSGPVVLASDDFNRADGGPGQGWTVIDSDPRIVGQRVQEFFASDGNDSIAIYTGRTWAADQYSQVTVLAASPHSGASAVVRAKNDPNIEMYFAYVIGPLGPGAQLVLAKFVGHIYTELWRDVVTVNAGDTLYLGVQGTTLTVKLNGVVMTAQSDGSIVAGYPGFDITDYDGQGASGDGQLDNWSAGGFDGTETTITAPGDVHSTAVTATQIDLAWTASTPAAGVAGYTILRNGVSIGTAATPVFVDGGLTPATSYTYTVVGNTAGGSTSAPSIPVAITTLPAAGGPDTEAPGAPGAFSGTAASSRQVSLTWTAATDNVGIAGYQVTRDGSLIATVTTLSYVDSGLTAGTTYLYAVVAVDAAGNTSAPASTSVTTPAESSGPVVLASDDFDRADGGPGPGWTVIHSDPRIVGQRVREFFASDGNDSVAIYTGRSWAADQYSQVTVVAASLHSGASAVVRAKNDSNVEMYFAYVVGPLGPGAQMVLAKFVGHVYTELWRDVVTVNAGDTLYLGAQGTTLTVKVNGVVITTQTDDSIAAGYPGFDITDYDGQGASGDGQLDNWSAGSL